MTVDIYDFDDHRKFLERWLRAKKSRSVRALALRIGCSPAYVTMVRKGTRTLNVDHARQWGEGLLLGVHELDYWEALVHAAHAPNEEDRRRAGRRVRAVQAFREACLTDSMVRMRANWLVGVVYEFAGCAGFRMEPAWIAPRLRPPATEEEVADALEVLTEMGALSVRDGVMTRSPSSSTGRRIEGDVLSAIVQRGHLEWVRRCETTLLEDQPPRIRTATIALDADRLDEVTERLTRMLIEAAEMGAQHEPNTSYKVALTVVPRSRRTDRDEP